MARLPIKQEVIRRLFALSGNECAEPSCSHELITTKGKYVAEICHIEAANPGGPRYNELQNDEDRRAFDNLILLCHKHHVESDDYELDDLRQMKVDHELKQVGSYTIPAEIEIKVVEEINTKLDRILGGVEFSISQNNEIMDALKQLSKTVTTPTASADTAIYAESFEFIKNLKKKGSYKTALEMLLQYKEKHWAQLNSELKFKTIANIAVLYLNLQDKYQAIRWILMLDEIDHSHPDKYAYLALGYGLKEDETGFTRVFNSARALECVNSNLWLGYLYMYEKRKSTEELLEQLPQEQLQKSEIVFTIADIFYRQNRITEAKSFIQKAAELETTSKIFLADIKAFMASKTLPGLLTFFKFMQRQYSAAEMQEIQTAYQHFTDAWNTFKDTEIAPLRTYCILNRGVLNNLLRRNDEAISDFQEAYRLTHGYMAFKNLMMTFLAGRKITDANKLLAEFMSAPKELTTEEKAELILFKARLLFLENDYPSCVQTMETMLTDEFIMYRQKTLNTIFHFSMEKQQFENASVFHALLEKDFPDDIETLLASVQLNVGKQDQKSAIETLDKANGFVSEQTEPVVIFELARAYSELREFDKAILLLERIADTSVYNDVTRTTIFCHYHMGNVATVAELAGPLFDLHPDNTSLADLMMKCFEELAQFENSIQACKKYIAQPGSKKKDLFRYNAAVLFARLKREDEKVSILNEISDFENLSQRVRYQIAYWFGTTGEKLRGLDLAYNTRSKFYDDPKAHAEYLQVVQHIKRKKKEVFPEKVTVDCGVKLEDESKQVEHYLITDQAVRGENVIPVNSVLAQTLLGRKKGENISFDKGFGLLKKYRIKEVFSKYTYAYQETMRLFETRFAGQESITVMKSDPEDPFADLRKMLREQASERSSFETDAFQKHISMQVPLTTIAIRSGSNFVREWGNWRGKPDFFQVAFAASGLPALSGAIRDRKPIVIDSTVLLLAALTLNSYRLLDLIDLPKFVAQSSLDEIQRFHEELGQFAEKGRTSVDFQDGNIVSHQIKKEQITHFRNQLSGIIRWCRNNTKITAPTKAGRLWRERAQIIEIVGKPTYDNLCIAEETGSIFCSDDAVIIYKLLPLHQLSGFSSFDIAQLAVANQQLDGIEFSETYQKMISASYISLPATTELIWREFDKAQFQVQKPFTTAAKSFFIMLPNFAAQSAAEFLKKLYVSITVDSTRTQTTLYIFKELSLSSRSAETFQLLPLRLNGEFKLLGLQLNIVLELLREFLADNGR